jgi:hypothetical protein
MGSNAQHETQTQFHTGICSGCFCPVNSDENHCGLFSAQMQSATKTLLEEQKRWETNRMMEQQTHNGTSSSKTTADVPTRGAQRESRQLISATRGSESGEDSEL